MEICASFTLQVIKTYILAGSVWMYPIVYQVSNDLNYKTEIIIAAKRANRILKQDFIFLDFKDYELVCNRDRYSEICIENKGWFYETYSRFKEPIRTKKITTLHRLNAANFYGFRLFGYESDIVFNSESATYHDREQFIRVLTHEFLHTFGWRHTKSWSIMSADLPQDIDLAADPRQEFAWLCYWTAKVNQAKFKTKQNNYREKYGEVTNVCNQGDSRFCYDMDYKEKRYEY